MGKRPTIADVAAVANVGIATVDRVLNSRKPVRDETAERVLKAAEDVGYHAVSLIKHRLSTKTQRIKLGFVLQKAGDPLYQRIASDLKSSLEARLDVRGEVVVCFVDDLSPVSIAAAITALSAKVDALACVALEHPFITQAVDDVASQGKPVFALMSDISAAGKRGYVGLDSRKVGRTAAWLISHTVRAGEVAIFVGSHRYFGQELSEIGFRSYMREYGQELRLLETMVNLDDPKLAYEATSDLLDARPNLVAIYDAGGGREGIIKAIRESGRDSKPVVICNELTATTRLALIDQTITAVLSLPTVAFAQATVDEMVAAVLGTRQINPNRVLPFEIYFSENLN